MAIRDLMNNYFYGKQGKGDFTLADLPQNRLQLFGAVLKVRWSQMVLLNALYLLIWIPAIIWTAMNLGALYNLADAATEAPAGGTASIILTWLLGMAPCIAITGPFNAGATYVLRNWARDEHSFVWSDYWEAVKNNWKQGLVISCISGVLPVIVYVAAHFYSSQLGMTVFSMVPIALVMLVLVIWTLSEMLMFPMLITYDLKLKDVIRNSVLLTVGKLPYAILIKLITLAVPAIVFAVLWFVQGAVGYVLLAVSVLYALFMLAFNKLVTVSYANWLCETYLNSRIEGARTNIGLRPENWDEVEFRPEDDE